MSKHDETELMKIYLENGYDVIMSFPEFVEYMKVRNKGK